ncbi:hypothetical protein CR194_19295 [Salipaludibacillus keqinensis]|uniref:Regulatory protein YycH domain-containing protein n=1 Tax=Salipaludibacillus keqinensis TaxID=2045207 RepID=A0A323T860_9BACI|nr:two-component system activity regulator YycH [Salipaludibacillus keqinensis]PYZ91769.1 hypothetical protein CR194_19295 [Salipaludibacillus keqinensis]
MIENLKTAILWLMILTSVALTWLIWTYQPAYNELEESGESYVEIEDIGDTRSLSEILHPKEVLVHNEEEISLVLPGNDRYDELDELMDTLDLEYLHPKGSNNAPSLERFYTGVEIVFAQPLKGEWLEELFSIEEQNIPIEEIDRMIFVDNSSSSVGTEVLVQFVDHANEAIYESDTSISVDQLEDFAEDTEEYHTPVEKRVFQERSNSDYQPIHYVTTEPITLRKYTYESQDLSSQAFTQILFSDPDFVRRYPQGGQDETFTDGNRMMTILDSGSILKYERPDVSSAGELGQTAILEDGLDFINSHSGWTNQFYADQWSETNVNDLVRFRLHVGGLPVFSSNMNEELLYTIELTRAGNQITEYTRPMFQLEDEPFEIDTTVRIPSFDVIELHIEENEVFSMDAVEGIRIGHKMERQRSFATFEPAWYVNIRGRWTELDIPSDLDREVIQDGLE